MMLTKTDIVNSYMSLSKEDKKWVNDKIYSANCTFLEFTSVEYFINAVKEHRYNSSFIIPESIGEKYQAHLAIQDAIDEFNGYYKDSSRWKDIEAVLTLRASDPFTDKDGDWLDKKYELLAMFVHQAYVKLTDLKLDKGLTENQLAESLFEVMETLEAENHAHPIPANSDDTRTYIVLEKYLIANNNVKCQLIQYEDTYEFSASICLVEEASSSYDYPKKEEDEDIEADSKFRYHDDIVEEHSANDIIFGTDDFFKTLDKEIELIREYGLDDSTIVNADTSKPVVNKRFNEYENLIKFMINFFYFNGIREVDTKKLFHEISKFITPTGYWPTAQYGEMSKVEFDDRLFTILVVDYQGMKKLLFHSEEGQRMLLSSKDFIINPEKSSYYF